MSENLNDNYQDLGTKECPKCEGKKKTVKFCGCLIPCFSCDEFEYEDCSVCEGEGVVARTDEDEADDYENAMEARREAEDDR